MSLPRTKTGRFPINDPAWLATTAWVVLALACATKSYLRPDKNTVFPIYTFAAGEWLAGRDVYVKMPGYDYYRYSPLLAAFFVPWRELGDAWGGAIWRLLGAGLLACGLCRWLRDAVPQLSRNQKAVVFLLVWPFALQNIHNGQSNVHMLGLLLLGLSDAATSRCWRSAIWFTLAALIKPYVLAIAGLAAVCEPRLYFRLAMTITGAVLATFAFQKPAYVAEQYHDWFFHFFENDRSNAAMRDWYRDLQLLFRVYLWPLPPKVYYVGCAVAGLIMALLVWSYRRISCQRHEVFLFAASLGCCWVTVLGPATESCTYLLLASVLAVGLVHFDRWPARILTLAYGMLAITIASALFSNNWKFQVLGLQPIAALIFLAVVLLDALAHMRRTVRMRQQRHQRFSTASIAA